MAPTIQEGKTWAAAFAKQARSDLETRELLSVHGANRCHQLHYLQMASEKICKASLYSAGGSFTSSHSVVQKHLPAIARQLLSERDLSGSRLKALKKLAGEIDKLAPALTGDGSRPDNVEYPWKDAQGSVIAPVDFGFPEIEDRQLPGLLKLLRAAATAYTEPVSS